MLEAHSITVRYGTGALAITEVSLSVAPGEIVAILGPNGAGKTTTLRALSGFLRSEPAVVTSGKITYEGTAVTGREPNRMARLGVVAIPERDKVFANLSVRDNLRALHRRKDGVALDAATDRVLAMFPFLRDRMNDVAGLLSGGQQQMLAIARGLLLEPTVLLIDEMTLGLHPGIHPQLYDAVRKIAARGTGVLLVDEGTSSTLEYADTIHVMSGGRIRASGPREQFGDRALLEDLYLAG
ncbi:ATP-binding cassette domain-containing protein [Amycolatopsis sp. NPDC005232]|uniref:ABC transporter ATP-binding protein n=1 Tax=Amycolatopsis sp. NPDC005232 TaxID=3157027 RepID=UPI0033A4243B